jgi:transcriptional regulator with XRE-family HTH domain
MTQADLGAVLGLREESTAAPRISRYERGERMPDHDSMEKLAQALGLPVAYFHATSDAAAETLLVMSRLNPEQQQALLDEVRAFAAKLGLKAETDHSE